jgi:hypothetical protein
MIPDIRAKKFVIRASLIQILIQMLSFAQALKLLLPQLKATICLIIVQREQNESDL